LVRSKDLVVKSKMFPHQNIHKYTWTIPGRNNRNLIDHILIDRRHSSIRDVQSFREADCDTVHCLVVPKVRERLTVSNRPAYEFHAERFNFRKLTELEVRKQYQIESANRFTLCKN